MNDKLIRKLQEVELNETIVYHIAPVNQRDNILKYGLDSRRALQRTSFSSGDNLYVFKNKDEAKSKQELKSTKKMETIIKKTTEELEAEKVKLASVNRKSASQSFTTKTFTQLRAEINSGKDESNE